MLANLTGVKIVVSYDVCRQDMNDLKELKRGLGKEVKLFGDEYSYCHISKTPNMLMDADSELAEDLENTLARRAAQDDHGIIEFPNVLLDVPYIEKTVNGPAFTIKWDPKMK